MSSFKNDIIPEVESINWTVDTSVSWATSLVNDVLNYINDSIFELLALVAIWAFIYIGFNLIKADWDPEKLKKAFINLIHVIIWIFVVAISWIIVKMVMGISF